MIPNFLIFKSSSTEEASFSAKDFFTGQGSPVAVHRLLAGSDVCVCLCVLTRNTSAILYASNLMQTSQTLLSHQVGVASQAGLAG